MIWLKVWGEGWCGILADFRAIGRGQNREVKSKAMRIMKKGRYKTGLRSKRKVQITLDLLVLHQLVLESKEPTLQEQRRQF